MSCRTPLAALLALSLAGAAAADIKRDVAGDAAPPAEQPKGAELPKPADTGTVEGTVTFKGKPLAAGYVNFHPDKGKQAFSGKIDERGTYTIKDVPVGKATVTITARPLAKAPAKPKQGADVVADELPPPPGKDAPKPPLLPAKYGDPKTSGLTAEVKKGQQRFIIELK